MKQITHKQKQKRKSTASKEGVLGVEGLSKQQLTEREMQVYSTVFRRFVAVFCAEDCIVSRTEITIAVGNYETFTLKGMIMLERGWTKYDDYTQKDKILPSLKKGDSVNINFKPTEKETTPPKHYTIETLNNYLKNPFKDEKKAAKEQAESEEGIAGDDSEDYKAIFEGLELGTEATRTGIIDNARKSGYIELKKDVYTILPDGEFLIEVLTHMQINMDKYKTSQLGQALKKVYRGSMTVEESVKLAEEEKCRYHICHISTKESVEIIREAKSRYENISCETAPHYLILCDEDLQEEGRFKMNPPLRAAEDRAALIEGIKDGTIEVIATDHAPHTAEEKSRGLKGSAMGIVGIETSFAICYTHLVRKGVITIEKLIALMSENPRRIFRLGGAMRVGERADIAVFDIREPYTIDPAEFQSMGKATPFEGEEVYGRCVLTLFGGKTVWRENK